jgi:hypothetical protein
MATASTLFPGTGCLDLKRIKLATTLQRVSCSTDEDEAVWRLAGSEDKM